jgi:hypothetical protein
MSHADEAPNAAQDPTLQPPADRKPREWSLVVGIVVVALALLLALLLFAWWYFGFAGWLD